MGWFSRFTGGFFENPGRTISNVVETVSNAWEDAEDFVEDTTGMTMEQVALVVVATAVTAGAGGFAVAVGEGALTAVGAGAVAGETIIGSATVASVTGGAIIGAGTGAINGAVQAAIVGGDIGEGILKGAVVGAVGGGAGMLAAGAAQGVLTIEVANGTLSVNEAKAITNAVQRSTANVIGASIQGRDIGTAAATGVLSGAVTPLLQDYTGLGNVASATLGGAISGAGTSAVTGGDPITGALSGAATGAVGAVVGPTLEQSVRSVLQGTPQTAGNVSAEISSAPLSHQETQDIRGYLNQLAAFSQAAGLPDQEIAARQAIEAMDEYYRQNESRFRNEDMMEMLGLSKGGTQPSDATVVTGGDEADVTVDDSGTRQVFTQEVVPDDTTSQYYGEEAAAGQAVNPAQQEYESYAQQLQESPYFPKVDFGTKPTKGGGTVSIDGSKFGGGAGGASQRDLDILQLISGGGPSSGNVTFTNVSADRGGPTTLGNVTFDTGNATTSSGNATTSLQPFGSDATRADTTTLQGFGADREAERPTETTTTTKKLPEPRVYTPPVYIDVNAPRRVATAAPGPVRSAGLDPATSGVLLGKYGKKNQVWNEATLRLADALGIR